MCQQVGISASGHVGLSDDCCNPATVNFNLLICALAPEFLPLFNLSTIQSINHSTHTEKPYAPVNAQLDAR